MTVMQSIIVMLVLMGGGPPRAGGTDFAGGDIAPPIALKETAKVRVIFLEHDGPYWTLGPIFQRVHELMAQRGETGAIYVRYAENPSTAAPSKLRTEIGFVRQSAQEVAPPFQSARRGGEQVAYAVVPGPFGTTARHHGRIYSWITEKGYEPIGPLVEIFDLKGPLAGPAERRTEIQIPVRALRQSKAESTGTPPISASPPRHDPPGAVFDQAVGTLQTEEAAGPSVMDLQADDELRGETTSTVAESDEPIGAAGPIGVSSASVGDRLAASPTTSLLSGEPGMLLDWNALAEQLLPEDRRVPASHEAWLGQLVFRFSAAARALPDRDSPVSAEIKRFAETTEKRFLRLSANFRTNPRNVASVRMPETGTCERVACMNLLRRLDVLLVQVGQGAAPPEEVARSVSEAALSASAILDKCSKRTR